MFTEEQKAAAEVDHSIVLLAGPGTGKTATVAGRVEYLLESGVLPSEIVVFTFTRRAAKELRDRIGSEASSMWIGTFHSVLLDALASTGRRPSVLDADAADAALDEIAVLLGHATVKNGSVVYTKRSRGHWRTQVDNCRLYPELSSPQAVEFTSAYASHLRINNDIDYTGILSLGAEVLEETPLANVKQTIVDEAQDTDWFQWSIVRRMAAWSTVIAVGDDLQLLYSWRGVKPEDFTGLPWPKMAITKSFRVPSDGIIAANRIAKAAGGVRPDLQVPPSDKSTIQVVDTGVVDLVRRMTSEMYAPSEIAVLCRYNSQVAEFGVAIQEAGLNISIAKRPPGGPIHKLLTYLAAPDSVSMRTNCETAWRPYLSLGVPKVVEYICLPSMSIDTCGALAKSWLGKIGVIVGPAQVLSNMEIPQHLISDARYYRDEYASCTLEQFSRECCGVYGQELSEQAGVAVLTVHQAKGLEWPCVIVPDCNNGMFPRNFERINNEERRIFFVAITRYQEQLFLLTDSRRPRSIFLDEAGL